MLGINKIIFTYNESITMILFNLNTINYNNINKQVDKDKLINYLKKICKIVHNWKNEYIDLKIIDGDDWTLDFYYEDGKITNHKGHGTFPNNFEQLKNLFVNINSEVLWHEFVKFRVRRM